MTVLFVSPDLMFASRVQGAAQSLGIKLQLVPAASDVASRLSGETKLVLVDLAQAKLDLPAIVSAVRNASPAARIVAYGPHVNEALLSSARAAGCNDVMANSQFHKEYLELLRNAIA